jgi:hypothetical protein
MIKIIPNFLSDEECKELSSWILQNHSSFTDANMGGARKTTRFLSNNVTFPKIAIEIRKRIKKYLQLEDAVAPPFIEGMVASYSEPGDTCFQHKDPEWHPNHHTLHCNVIVQKPNAGGNAVIENREYDVAQGDLLCYYVSDLSHGATKVIGDKHRLMWVFGFCVEKKVGWHEHYTKKNFTFDSYIY